MRRALILVVVMLCGTAVAQLDRPTALTEMQKCSGLTCIWDGQGTATQTGPYVSSLRTIGGEQGDNKSRTFLVVKQRDEIVANVFLQDLTASVTLTWSVDYKNFAVTWSKGGAIGSFDTKVFRWDGTNFVELPAVTRAFHHFESRHDCKTRGDNVQAYRFEESGAKLMLILSVYPTGDCGLEAGYTEGYLVRVLDGSIQRCINNRGLISYLKHHPEGR